MENEKNRYKLSKINHESVKFLPLLIFTTEYLTVLIAQKLSLFIQHNLPLKNGLFYIPDFYFYVLIPFIFIFFSILTNVNEKFIPYPETLRRFFYTTLYGEIFCIILLYMFKTSNYVSRSYIVIFFFILFICLPCSRYLLIRLCKKLNVMKETVLFWGTSDITEKIIKVMCSNNCFGINAVKIPYNKAREKMPSEKYCVLDSLQETKEYIKKHKIRTVIIIVPGMDRMELLNLIEELQPLVRELMFVPDIVGMPVFNVETKKLYEDDMILLDIKNNLLKKTNRRIKHIFDIVFSLLTMVIIIPVSIIVMVLIMIESPKAAPIFKHYRVGKGGKLFPCYKFRSMVPNAQEKLENYLKNNLKARKEWQANFKLKDDPRITKVGKFIRRTSIDELPQVINVLKGEMSWVGPRPIVEEEKRYYDKNITDYCSVLPGITGMWQVSGRSDTKYDERVKMDVWYIRNWSIWIDIAILLKTLKAVLTQKGAV